MRNEFVGYQNPAVEFPPTLSNIPGYLSASVSRLTVFMHVQVVRTLIVDLRNFGSEFYAVI